MKDMMKKLIRRKLLALDTEVLVRHKVKDFGDSYMDHDDFYNVIEVKENELVGSSCVDGSKLSFGFDQVLKVDGMTPKRLCDAFKIK